LEPAREAEIYFIDPALTAAVRTALPLACLTRDDGLVVGNSHTFWTSWRQSTDDALPPIDARLACVLEFINRALGDGALPLAHAARAAGLSVERFRHLFAERVGLPYRRYLLWRRLALAVTAITSGASATCAAHEAGFADAAHFARTMKAAFGVSASAVLLGS
jgi:AraC-like DNA-binding protein